MAETEEKKGSNRAAVITVLVILLVVVTVVVLQMIERAPSAGGPGGPPPGGDGGMPPAAVMVAGVTREKTQEQAIVTGLLRASSKTDVAAREAGAVEKVWVDEGVEVKLGDPLAELDDRRLKLQLAEATAALASAKSLREQRGAELRRAETDHEMKRGLRATKAVSESDLLDADKTLKAAKSLNQAAEAGIREAESRLELLKVKLDDLVVKASQSGVVVDRRVEPGEWVANGAVVASIVAVDPVEAWLRVPARFLGGAREVPEGFRVRRSSTGELFNPAKVTRIPEVDGRSQLFTLVATIPNAARKLVPGESVTGIVPIGEAQDYWRIPVNAIVYSPQGTMIYVVQPGEEMPTGRNVPVTIAFQRDGFAFVAATNEGIQDGDQVVVEGNQRLRPGQPLMIKPAAEAGHPTP